nr:hypothetical protein [Tanacetum cinerariifolium]
RADPDPRLSKRQSRHQPFPGGGRHVVPDPRTARCRAVARGRQHRGRSRPASLHSGAVPR